MTRTVEEQVIHHLHSSFGLPRSDRPTLATEKLRTLRVKLIMEEAKEFMEACGIEYIDTDGVGFYKQVHRPNIIKIADALGDLLVVVYGAAATFGIEMADIFDEIHNSNMSKLDAEGKPILREDGKFLKGPNYFAPDVFSLILAQAKRWEMSVCEKWCVVGEFEEVAIHHNLGCDAL
jgi:predicted HAD superfamily Cof-like phosphohydrolase